MSAKPNRKTKIFILGVVLGIIISVVLVFSSSKSSIFSTISSSISGLSKPPPKIVYSTFENGTLDGWKGSTFDTVGICNKTPAGGYSARISKTEGDPAPSVFISGDGFEVDGVIYRNIEKQAGKELNISVDIRAASGYSGSVVTNANVWICNGKKLAYRYIFVKGGKTDTGWATYNITTTNTSSLTNVTIMFGLSDGWIANWNQQNWYDNISISNSGGS